jgi:hypothetical protein
MRNGVDWTDKGFFVWRRVSPFRDWFELRAGEFILATLMIKGLMIAAAQVDRATQRFAFQADGPGNQRIKIHETNGEELLVAWFERGLKGRAGTLRFVNGGELQWRQVGWRRKRTYVFTDRFGNPLVYIHPDGTVAKHIFDAGGSSSIASSNDLMLLVSLGWFVLIISGNAASPMLSVAGEP